MRNVGRRADGAQDVQLAPTYEHTEAFPGVHRQGFFVGETGAGRGATIGESA